MTPTVRVTELNIHAETFLNVGTMVQTGFNDVIVFAEPFRVDYNNEFVIDVISLVCVQMINSRTERSPVDNKGILLGMNLTSPLGAFLFLLI